MNYVFQRCPYATSIHPCLDSVSTHFKLSMSHNIRRFVSANTPRVRVRAASPVGHSTAPRCSNSGKAKNAESMPSDSTLVYATAGTAIRTTSPLTSHALTSSEPSAPTTTVTCTFAPPVAALRASSSSARASSRAPQLPPLPLPPRFPHRRRHWRLHHLDLDAFAPPTSQTQHARPY
jgi:hypothetical protein